METIYLQTFSFRAPTSIGDSILHPPPTHQHLRLTLLKLGVAINMYRFDKNWNKIMYIMDFSGLQTPQQIHPAHVSLRCALYFLCHITKKGLPNFRSVYLFMCAETAVLHGNSKLQSQWIKLNLRL